MRFFKAPVIPGNESKWSIDNCYVNDLPSFLFLTYCFKNKEASFNLSGGHDGKQILSFSTSNHELYNAIYIELYEHYIQTNERFNFNPKIKTLEFSYKDILDVKIFFNILDKNLPFPDDVKKDIESTLFALEKTLTKENERNSSPLAT